jgi:hypothetical protein
VQPYTNVTHQIFQPLNLSLLLAELNLEPVDTLLAATLDAVKRLYQPNGRLSSELFVCAHHSPLAAFAAATALRSISVAGVHDTSSTTHRKALYAS